MAEELLAPVDYAVVAFPDGILSDEGFHRLLALCDAGTIRLLDLEFIVKSPEGVVSVVSPSDLAEGQSVDLSIWEGACSGLFDADDIAEIGESLNQGGIAVAFVIENTWLFGVIDGWLGCGARLVADSGVSAVDIVGALDLTEPKGA